jgi:hypothetical protein
MALGRGLLLAREAPRSKGGRLGPEMGWAGRPGPISTQSATSFARCRFPSLLDPSSFYMWALVVSFSPNRMKLLVPQDLALF